MSVESTGTSDRLLTLGQVAEVLSGSVRTVWRLVARGELPAPVKVGRSARLCLSDVETCRGRRESSRFRR